MTLAIKHNFVTAKTDGSDSTLLKPSNWNDTHAITLATNNLIGRASAGAGAAEEIPTSAAVIALLASPDLVTFLANLGVSPATTGDGRITLKTVAPAGWVMMNDGGIGDASSYPSTRNNVDCLALFTLLYNNITDGNAPVYTQAGVPSTRAAQGTAAAAWSAHCLVLLPRQLGRAIVGAGTGSGLTVRPLGNWFGGDTVNIDVTNLPPYTPAGTLVVGAVTATTTAPPLAGNNNFNGGGGGSFSVTSSGAASVTINQGASSWTGAPQGGANTPLSIAQASTAWNVMVKL